MMFKVKHPTLTSDDIDVIFQVYDSLGDNCIIEVHNLACIINYGPFALVYNRKTKYYYSNIHFKLSLVLLDIITELKPYVVTDKRNVT